MLRYLSYLAIVCAFAFVTLSLASGLLYVSELIEEHSRLAKVYGKRGIYVVIGLHIILYFTDNLPFVHTLFSIICHAVYLQNFSDNWPVINLTSVSFIASCVLVLADHFIWFFHFARVSSEARRLRTYRVVQEPPGFSEIASFFALCVWLVPLFLFLSLSANDHAIPLTSIETSSPGIKFSSQQRQPVPRGSLLSSILSYISFNAFPRIRKRDAAQGLIAPVSRPVSPSPGHLTPATAAQSPRPNYLAAPNSPMSRAQEIEVRTSGAPTSPNFRLNTPPRRSTDLQRPHATSSALGLGIRRPSGQARDTL